MREHIQVYTSTDKNNAELIADTLVNKRLVACVQIVGLLKSVFRFKGKIEKNEEYLCIIKTDSALFDLVGKVIKEVHSYDLPEIIATAIMFSSKDYSNWLSDSIQ